MARNTTDEDVRVLRGLEQSGQLQGVIGIFERRQRQVDLALRKIAPDIFISMQGRAQELEDLIAVFTSDRKVSRG